MKLSELWKRYGFLLISVLAIIIVVIASVSIAKAASTSATITWIHPVAYVDGSSLPVSDIKETVVTWRRPGNSVVVGTAHVAGPATTTVVTGLVCGNFNFTAATVVMTNSTSAETPPALYATGVVCAPNPPTGLKVT